MKQKQHRANTRSGEAAASASATSTGPGATSNTHSHTPPESPNFDDAGLSPIRLDVSAAPPNVALPKSTVVVEHTEGEVLTEGEHTSSETVRENKRCGGRRFTPKFLDFPWPVKLIILNEVCERFSYYGTRALLTLFMRNRLNYSEDASIALPSMFSSVAYFLPLLGGYIADAHIGHYPAILIGSYIYMFSSVTLVLASWTKLRALLYVALAKAAIATGLIKPCVSVFGADQLSEEAARAFEQKGLTFGDNHSRADSQSETPAQRKKRLAERMETFFYTFYFVINLGSVLSLLCMPPIRTHVSYTVAFIIPAVLNGLAFLFFWLGRNYYYKPIKHSTPIKDVWNVIKSALSTGCCRRAASSDADQAASSSSESLRDSSQLLESSGSSDSESKENDNGTEAVITVRREWWDIIAQKGNSTPGSCCSSSANSTQPVSRKSRAPSNNERTPLLLASSSNELEIGCEENALQRGLDNVPADDAGRPSSAPHQCVSPYCFCSQDCPCKQITFDLSASPSWTSDGLPLPNSWCTNTVRPHMRKMRKIILRALEDSSSAPSEVPTSTKGRELMEFADFANLTAAHQGAFHTSCCCIQRMLVERQLSQLLHLEPNEEKSDSDLSQMYLKQLEPRGDPPLKWLDNALVNLDRKHAEDVALVGRYLRGLSTSKSESESKGDPEPVPRAVVERFGKYIDAREVRRLEIKHTRRILMLVLLFSALPAFWCLTAQQGSTWVMQADEMKREIKFLDYTIDPEQMQLLNPAFLFILLPLFDWFFRKTSQAWALTSMDGTAPHRPIQRVTWKTRLLGFIHMHPLTRVVVGMLVAAAAYCVAAAVDFKIHEEARAQYPLPPGVKDPVPTVSILWQIPQYFLITLAEVLVSVTFNKYTVDMSPPQMKSLAMALLMASSAVGDFLTGLLYLCLGDIARRYLFFGFAGLVVLNAVYFIFVSRMFMNYLDYEVEEDDYLAASTREAFARDASKA